MKEKNFILSNNGQPDEEHIEKLIRIGGKRDDIDPACRERVRQHLLRVWSEQQEKSNGNKKSTEDNNQFFKNTFFRTIPWYQPWSLAAGILCICISIFMFQREPQSEVIASVVSMQGSIYLQENTLKNGDTIRTGQKLHTTNATMTLKWHDGAILKFDRQTQIHFINKHEVSLLAGAIYFDSNDSSHIRIHTSRGVVSDIGTQFETRLQPKNLLVRVREGEVKVEKQKGNPLYVTSGKALQLTDEHNEISDITKDDQWLWVDAMDEDFNFDGRTMAEVLSWIAQRENWTLQFKSEQDKKQAQEDILHGKLNITSSQELLKQLSLISDMQYQITNNTLIVNYL